MKLFIALVIAMSSLSVFAQSEIFGCLKSTRKQIESVKTVKLYKASLIKVITSEVDSDDLIRASAALRLLDTNVDSIAMEACEATVKR